MDIINTEREQLGLPPNLRGVPQMMKALIITTLNLWRTQCEFLHVGSNSDKTIKKCWILLQQVEELKTHRQILEQKGNDHIDGAPAEDAKFRVLRALIRISQAIYRQANSKQESLPTYRITTEFQRIHQSG